MLFYVFFVLLLAAFCLYRWRRYRFSLFKELGIPGPEPSLISGNLSELTKKGEIAAFEEWIPKYGDIIGFYNGATPILIVKDLDLIKNIQIQDFSNFHDRGIVSKFAREHQLSKLSLLNALGDDWKDMRRILIPAFASSKVKKSVDQDFLQLLLNAEAEDDRATNTHTRKEDNDNTRYLENKTSLRKTRLLTNVEIQCNVISFLVDGVETASTAMTFMAYLLAKHPDIQDKVRSEASATLEKDGEFNSGNITSLRYMDQVISEALRVYPPITGFVTRTCEKDYDWNGLKIPAGMSIKIPVYQLHHDRNLWHEPEKFDPERFSDDNKGNIVPMAYQAYGNGPHNCIGMRFAQLELKLMLAKLLANYKLLLDEKRMKENPFELDSSSIFCYPRKGVWLKLQKISSVL